MAGGVLATTNTPNNNATPPAAGSIGAVTDTGATQNNINREFEMNGAPGDGNQVDVQDSQDNVTFFFVVSLFGGERKVVPTIARYYRTVRQLGTAAVVVQYGDSLPTSSSAGAPLTNLTIFSQANLLAGGNIDTNAASSVDKIDVYEVAQTTAGQALTFFSPTSGATLSNSVYLDDTGSASFTAYGATVQPGTFGIYLWSVAAQAWRRASYASLGGDALGATVYLGTNDAQTAQVGANAVVGYAQTSGGNLTLGTVTALAATRVQAGGASPNAGKITLLTGTGQALGALAAGSIDVQTDGTSNGTIRMTGSGTGGISLVPGTGGTGIGVAAPGGSGVTIDTTAAGPMLIGTVSATTIRVGGASSGIGIGVAPPAAPGVTVDTGAAGALNLGNANATTVRVGGASAGIGIGVAAPAAPGVTIDTGAAGTVLLANTNATTLTMGGGALATASLNLGAAGTINVGSAAVTTTLNLGTGTAVYTVHIADSAQNHVLTMGATAATTGSTRITSGSGGIGIGVAAPGGSGVTVDTPNAGALLLGSVAATTVRLGGAASGVGIGVAPPAAPGITIAGATSTLGFFGATPVVQAAVSTNANRVVAGATAANTESTYDGGVGGNAYTVGGIVLRLKQYGLLS